MLTVLVPCAGEGRRFKEQGYTLPKPLIGLDNNYTPMVVRAVSSLVPQTKGLLTRYVFIVLNRDVMNHGISRELWSAFPSSYCIEIPEPTTGAAVTCLTAKQIIDNDQPLVIANSDQIIDGGWGPLHTLNADGAVLTMKGDGTKKWSYLESDSFGRVTRVVEKDPISDRATCGVYWFARGSDFCKYAAEMLKAEDKVNGEFYVAPVFNYMIRDGRRVEEVKIESYGATFHGLGTPEDLREYLKLKIKVHKQKDEA